MEKFNWSINIPRRCDRFIGIEFFSEHPLDNIISSTKFKYDKVVFYGYKDVMDKTAVKYNIGMHEIDVVKDDINIMSVQESYDKLPKRNIYLNIQEFLVLHEADDVLNEIDILYMRNNIPTFVSCKNQEVSKNMPLYELETVADRFGGENVRKVLVAAEGFLPAIKNRADEMGIILLTL